MCLRTNSIRFRNDTYDSLNYYHVFNIILTIVNVFPVSPLPLPPIPLSIGHYPRFLPKPAQALHLQTLNPPIMNPSPPPPPPP